MFDTWRRIVSLLLVLLGLLGTSLAGVAEDVTEEEKTIQFFYKRDCPTCHLMKPFMDKLLELNPELPLEILEADEHPEAWQRACEAAGIPVWGVPRLFVGKMVFADWSTQDGELIYVPSYYGYMGFKNQIVKAISDFYSDLIIPEEAS